MQVWTRAYADQLHRLQLFALANDVIRRSEDEQICSLNQRSTTVSVGGGGASASQNRPAKAVCAVCRLTVRGLFVWCQGCSHGGHEACLRPWYELSLECPTGCGHCCLLRPPSRSGGLRSGLRHGGGGAHGGEASRGLALTRGVARGRAPQAEVCIP